MQFFLYEIVARIVAIYLCVDCGRNLWRGLVERKVANFDYDFLGRFFDWSNWVVHRDIAPVRYWIQIGIETFMLAACVVVAIFGWWRPDT